MLHLHKVNCKNNSILCKSLKKPSSDLHRQEDGAARTQRKRKSESERRSNRPQRPNGEEEEEAEGKGEPVFPMKCVQLWWAV